MFFKIFTHAHSTVDAVLVTKKISNNYLTLTDSVERQPESGPVGRFNAIKPRFAQKLDVNNYGGSVSLFERTFNFSVERDIIPQKITKELEFYRNDRTQTNAEGDGLSFRGTSSRLVQSVMTKNAHVHVNKTVIQKSIEVHRMSDERLSLTAALNINNDMDLNSFAAAEGQLKVNSSLPLDDAHSNADGGSRLRDVPSQNPFVSDDDVPVSSSLVSVISMSLYGSDTRYTTGAIRNAQLAQQHFPDWQLWLYIDSSDSPRYGAVPSSVVSRLVELGAFIHYVTPQEDFIPPMMWRFLVADDPAVDRFIVRDVDSRLTRRDAAAVGAWIRSGRPFQCIRDHPSHAGFAVSGGLWGGRAPDLRRILRRSWAAMMRGLPDGYLNDMNFLNNVIWPRIEKHVYCSDSVSCDRWTGAVPFPVARHGYEHVGQVFDENDLARRIDMQILQQSGENTQCIPS
jgi:hypothetical protein